jgi:signal transduction histidine kinase
MAFYKREQSIAEEKDNFITLASHYLYTPIATMRDSASLMLMTGDIDEMKSGEITKTLAVLRDKIAANLEEAKKNTELIEARTEKSIKPKPVWASVFFWVPIGLAIVLTILANFLIGVVGERDIGLGNVFFQLGIIAVFVVILYIIVRNYYIQKVLQRENNALISNEQAIDMERNNFLDQQARNISTALVVLRLPKSDAEPSRSHTLYQNGLTGLVDVHDKFLLFSQIRTGESRNTSTFSLKSIVNQIIENEKENIKAKNLTVEASVEDISVTQNRMLFAFVISSIIDNAIKFANEGGRVDIDTNPGNKSLRIKITDNGRGINPEKMDQLFKPFSRTESAVDFLYEGLGLSLFLDRLILAYTGGSISVDKRPGGGAVFTVVTPTEVKDDLPGGGGRKK